MTMVLKSAIILPDLQFVASSEELNCLFNSALVFCARRAYYSACQSVLVEMNALSLIKFNCQVMIIKTIHKGVHVIKGSLHVVS